jgi:hypothetical protein
MALARYATMIPRDHRAKQQRQMGFKDVETHFLICLKRFLHHQLPPVLDAGATVIEMPNDCQIVKTHPLIRILPSFHFPSALPNECCAFYRGKYSSNPKHCNLSQVECAIMGLQKMTVITLSSLHFVIPTSIGAIGVTNM